MRPLVWAHTTFETLCNLTLHPTLRCFMHSRYFKISNRSGSKICQDTSPWLRWRLRFPRRAPPVLACLRCTPLGHLFSAPKRQKTDEKHHTCTKKFTSCVWPGLWAFADLQPSKIFSSIIRLHFAFVPIQVEHVTMTCT